jgi:molecular chaperone GrpE
MDKILKGTNSNDNNDKRSNEVENKEQVESNAPDLNALKSKMEENEKLLIEKDKETKEMKDKYLRALAEVENVRNMMNKQIQDIKLYALQDFSKDILNVADVLEKAVESVPQSELEGNTNPSLSSLFVGLKMTETELQKVFKKYGLVRMDPLGELFDPHYHEALFQVPGDHPGTVATVSMPGYTLNGRTIRPAQVAVVQAKP